MTARRLFLLMMSRFLLVLGVAFSDAASAENITPAQEQEFTDAKVALEAARKVPADKFALSYIKQAEDFLKTADSARQMKDVVRFSQASRLARSHAELAQALAELNVEVEKLATTNNELQKARAEIESLKKSP